MSLRVLVSIVLLDTVTSRQSPAIGQVLPTSPIEFKHVSNVVSDDGLSFKEEDAFQEISSQVNNFESRLEEVQSENMETIKERKHSYGVKLDEQTQENIQLAASNAHLAEDIGTLKRGNQFLRTRAKAILNENDDLRAQLKAMQANFSIAWQFANLSLMTSSRQAIPALKVLETLDAQDKAEDEIKEHEMSIREITDRKEELLGHDDDILPHKSLQFLALQGRVVKNGGKSVSLPRKTLKFLALHEQVLNGESSGTNGMPLDEKAAKTGVNFVLQKMQSNLETLSQQHEDNAHSLERLFKKKWHEGLEHHDALMKEHDYLEENKRKLLDVQQRLNKATDHLKHSHDHMLDIRTALGDYMQRVARSQERGVPLSTEEGDAE